MTGPPLVIGRQPWNDGYPSHTVAATGPIRSATMQQAQYPLWLLSAVTEGPCRLQWDNDHGDEAVYLCRGTATVNNVMLRAPAAFIVERSTSTIVDLDIGSSWRHFGASVEPHTSNALGPATDVGTGVRTRAEDEAFPYHVTRNGKSVFTQYWFDSSLPTTRVTMLSVTFDAGYRAPSHSHTADELIHLLDGTLNTSGSTVQAGETLAIAANTRYGFTVGEQGCTFVNYRPTASHYVPSNRSKEPYLEVVTVLRDLPTDRP